ncbi:hypothetical protein ACFOYW_11450 [Gryllotalpicola reticulitermitis]|uniref:Uncharacterized protein n=1 Tax=Gryllotalpicola reticulitermitis TaxID=1184153 RepID=A0ABV8Q6N1_9MICO
MTGWPLRLMKLMRRTASGRVRGAPARASRMHSGQITPTGAGVWHSPQIVRPQR